MALYGHDHSLIAKNIFGCYFNDQQTIAAIKSVYDKFGYIVDPHGAIGYLGIEKFFSEYGNDDFAGVFFETAHPVKFPDVIHKALNIYPPSPTHLSFSDKPEKVLNMPNSFRILKEYLLNLD